LFPHPERRLRILAGISAFSGAVSSPGAPAGSRVADSGRQTCAMQRQTLTAFEWVAASPSAASGRNWCAAQCINTGRSPVSMRSSGSLTLYNYLIRIAFHKNTILFLEADFQRDPPGSGWLCRTFPGDGRRYHLSGARPSPGKNKSYKTCRYCSVLQDKLGFGVCRRSTRVPG
jgi:hypothetical protein